MYSIDELKFTTKRKEILKKLDLNTVEEILNYYPIKYDNLELTAYNDFEINNRVIFVAEIITNPTSFRYKTGAIVKVKAIIENENEVLLTIFNRPWAKQLHISEKIVVIGKVEDINRITVINYYNKDISDVLGIVPIYSLKNGINQNDIKKIIEFTLKKVDNEIIDDIPNHLMIKHHLIPYKEALYEIHKPSTKNNLSKAIARIKYEEFLKFYLALSIISGDTKDKLKQRKEFDIKLINKLIASLEFDLTIDQKRTLDEILLDLSSTKVMYRLVEGDVGSGKTIVSLLALYANYLSGFAGVLMAPTEILAKQHYEEFKNLLEPLGIKVELLYANVENKKDIIKRCQKGEVDIVVGTHSLFGDEFEIKNLGLVITDEQQRFGVKQRRKLKDKGINVDFLLMSATPIPRTLASAIYGDMDISIIKTLPKGRKGCDTFFINQNSIVSIIEKLKHILDEGRQIYIIASSIDKSDSLDVKDATQLYSSMLDVFKPYNLGLLHGKLTSDEKKSIMQKFEDNKIQILVSTTVVEVGVNVKNATCMVIYDADRFGLSQLHQLRGRVQRSSYKGECYLLSKTNDEDTKKRLEVLVNTNDGFEIANEDLKIRGPGDILGTRQSGLPDFILGDIFKDTNIIDAAKNDVNEIIANLDDFENNSLYQKIKSKASKNYID